MGSPGRPKGTGTGPMPISWVCAGLNNNIEQAKEYIRKPTNSYDVFTQEQAVELFLNEFGFTPNFVFGPFRKHLGVKRAVSPAARIPENSSDVKGSVNMELAEGKAIYDGWEGVIFPLEGQPERVNFMALQHLTDASKNKPALKVIDRSLLTLPKKKVEAEENTTLETLVMNEENVASLGALIRD